MGIDIDYDRKRGKIILSQSNYIESLAERYDIVGAKSFCTPMEQNLSLIPAQAASNDLNYRDLIIALLYISTSTRLAVS